MMNLPHRGWRAAWMIWAAFCFSTMAAQATAFTQTGNTVIQINGLLIGSGTYNVQFGSTADFSAGAMAGVAAADLANALNADPVAALTVENVPLNSLATGFVVCASATSGGCFGYAVFCGCSAAGANWFVAGSANFAIGAGQNWAAEFSPPLTTPEPVPAMTMLTGAAFLGLLKRRRSVRPRLDS